MLELSRVSWGNFLSYGDYTTTLELAGMGPCLITGEVVDEDHKEAYDVAQSGHIKKSNGAGKSTAATAIQWGLFGRTMHSAAPGDKVINYFTGKDCWVKTEFKNGDYILRTRGTEGKNELIYGKDGEEQRSLIDTAGTAKIQQEKLNRLFGLDFEIFCGSTFFSQYGRPWMEMADQARKKALERLLRVDRFGFYAKVAKGKSDKLTTQVERLQGKKTTLENEITRLETETTRLQDAAANFATRQQTRHDEAIAAADEADRAKGALKLPDLDKLKAKWELVAKIQERIAQQEGDAYKLRDEANDLNDAISEHDSTAEAAAKKVALWQAKEGKVCSACEQTVPQGHVHERVEPLQARADEARRKATEARQAQKALRDRYKDLMATVEKTKAFLTEKKPSLTVRDAQSVHNQWKQFDQEGQRLRRQAATILEEASPHGAGVDAVQTRIAICREEIATLDTDIARQDLLSRHYFYIHKCYNDRNKIKSQVFREHIPFINSRLKHYLDVFGLDVRLELTDSLGVETNMWDYEFQSGGERKRTDVAFMLATFDFHEFMFGRQCNVLVLDEVDGRMDDDGIDSLIGIIKNDLASRVETVLIISHRDLMKDTFPREIKVKRRGRMSRLEVI